jgi:DNA primase large subunit
MAITPRHARYPFFAAAREAVREADIDPGALIAADAPAVERATERVERALMAGTVAPESPERWGPREELLSYPIARILVSLVDQRAAVEKYATAEAATAAERFREDFESDDDDGLRSVDEPTVSRGEALAEFDLGTAVDEEADGYSVAVGTYLDLTNPRWGDRWRLVNRALWDGRVRISEEDLDRLLEEAVRRRVAEGLPFDVRSSGGEELAEALATEVATLREMLGERTERPEVETVVPALFPPCMRALLTRAGSEESLPRHSRFALVGFLVSVGLSRDEVATLTGIDDEELTYETAVLSDGGAAQYPPPSCATMQAYGDCVDPDERCETISHPLSYYAAALADAGDVADWRG